MALFRETEDACTQILLSPHQILKAFSQKQQLCSYLKGLEIRWFSDAAKSTCEYMICS